MNLAPVKPKTYSKISEAELQRAVVQYATLRGWRLAHFRPAKTGKGWRTPMCGDTGYPDLTMVRRDRLVFAELKREGKKPTADQERWLGALREASPYGGFEVYVWTPADWIAGRIDHVLA